MAIDRAAWQSLERLLLELVPAQSVHARRRQGTDLSVRWLMAQDLMGAYRRIVGTIGFRQPAPRQRLRLHPRWYDLARLRSRTDLALRDVGPAASLVTEAWASAIDPISTFSASSTPPVWTCCNDCLNSPLTAYHAALELALKADAHRPRHERRTARALYTQIEAQGYAGCYSRVTDFIRGWRQGEGQSIATKAFVPLAFELGEAFQFDWSEEGQVVGGIYYRMQVSHLKLCASRAFWLVAYPSQGHEMLFDAHEQEAPAAHGLPVPAEEAPARAGEPRLGDGHHLHPHDARWGLLGGPSNTSTSFRHLRPPTINPITCENKVTP